MEQEELKTSEEWYPILYPEKELIIYDPDGWDRKNWTYSWFQELITKDEFVRRAMQSTCIVHRVK